ncbi:MAG TPA: GGDEF domain-containing protein [Streptosporangiaceae bacterium]|jgi:diguanylate cyclase (GGDEF)-like protein
MSAVSDTVTGDRRGARLARPRRWPFVGQPPLVRAYVTFIVGVYVVALVHGVLVTPVRGADLYPFAGLVLCGGVCVEATRRLGLPPGVSRDMLSAWWLPIAILLPPAYALIAPIPLSVVLYLRARPMLLFRRVFNTAAIGLAGGIASVLFSAVVPSAGSHDPRWLIGAGTGPVYAVACGLVFTAVNIAVVAVAVRAAAPESRWRDLLGDREAMTLDLVELCAGVLVTIACALSPMLLLIALPPVILLQRSLLHQQLQTAACTDAKTGLLNAAAWHREAATVVTRTRRTGHPLAVLIADVDHFKRVNDTHGHLVGDQVLIGVAGTLRTQVRESDLVGRFGGEEFVVLLPRTDAAEAMHIAERLRTRVASLSLPGDDTAVRVTISIGVALLGEHGADLVELLAAADLGLYRAKETGRDRVCVTAQRV